jgi:serine phosphatase RsbU (regulator of sigma subunit)
MLSVVNESEPRYDAAMPLPPVADDMIVTSPAADPQTDAPRRRRLPSIRLLITLIVVLPIAVVSAALMSIAFVTSRSIAEQLGERIVTSATERTSSDVYNYLDSAMRVSNLYARRVADGTLSLDSFAKWEPFLFADLATNPDVASICFTTPGGDCTWLLRAHGRLELGTVNGNNRDHALEFAATPDGTVDRSKPLRDYHYDATARPWYQIAMTAPGPTWTPIYFWFGENGAASTTGTGYTRVVKAADGSILGVLIIDVTLDALSDHLRQMHGPSGAPGWTFLVDNRNLVVAASEGAVNSDAGNRITPAESDSPVAQAIAPLLWDEELRGGEAPMQEGVNRRVWIKGQPAVARITPMAPYEGINWHVASVIPEASFMSTVTSLRIRSTALASGMTLASLALGLILSRRLSGPLVRLAQHVARVGAGDFESRLNLGHASELRRLSDEVNRMAAGLKHRMELQRSMSVATSVQQSLLPRALPSPDGLEIAACSRFCDSTGGDYYDFLQMPALGGKALVAVGDVTGHGIGAALLMATARGAVRAAAAAATTIAQVMNGANDAMAGHTNNGMFMTMVLLSVDPQTREVRWSSAGHDPALIYHPDSDSFEELVGGDVPLGIEAEMAYREHSRPCATSGAIILIGTDGIWEARNANGEMFGKQRLRQLIKRYHSSAEDLAEAIQRAMWSWIGPRPLQDDVTFVAIRVADAK